MLALASTDARIRAGKSSSPSFLFATLLWHEELNVWNRIKTSGEANIPALFQAMEEVLAVQGEKLAITRRIAGDIKEIWALQPRLEQRSGKRPYGVLEHPRFRAAYDFLCLRAEAGEVDGELARWWTDFQDADGETRARMLLPESAPKKKRRRRRKAAAGASTPETALDTPAPDA
jgi:poly(A) polymerase